GADFEEVLRGLRALPVPGWSLEAAKTTRAGLTATELHVGLARKTEPEERTWAHIRDLVDQALPLPPRVRERAQKVFSCLACAEASVHGTQPEEVHFHEVGSVDAIIDVVGTCLALESLAIAEVWSSPVAFGMGLTGSAHDLLPHPAPAVLELLKGAPVYGTEFHVELATPTGAALLAGLARGFGPMPPMNIVGSGYGAGAADLGVRPNVLQVVVGDRQLAPAEGARGWSELLLLETNVDDVTGEVLAHTIGRLLAAGALDAWLVTLTGKKGRPGYVLNALVLPWAAAEIAEVMATETGSLGIRQHAVQRWAAPREVREVEVDGFTIRVKVGPHRAKAEYEDCAQAAGGLGLPLAEVARRAEQLAAGATIDRAEI
ncbi:MAG TPA: nickel pincer cofactor biosynthesis protein LarC, partial [Acidimicrobiales bacterium]|nr:nickel pincer cofactor biosynthesis protein LarC [Acidimicrobiales bacterium]